MNTNPDPDSFPLGRQEMIDLLALDRDELEKARLTLSPQARADLDRLRTMLAATAVRSAVGDPSLGSLRSLAVMFTDMAGSTEFAQKYGDVEARAKQEIHNDLLLPLIESHDGTLVKTIGDALMVTFDDAPPAARCAAQMQRCLHAYNTHEQPTDPDRQIHIRCGIHWGKAILYQDRAGIDITGSAANVAARVETGGGKQTDQILLSASAFARLLPVQNEFPTAEFGTITAKGVGRLQLFQLLWQENAAIQPLRLAADTAQRIAHRMNEAENTRGIHCLFVDESTGRGHVRPVFVRVDPAAAPSLTTTMKCDRVMQAAIHRAIHAAFDMLRRIGFPDASPDRHAIEWWIEGQPAAYSGASIGLGAAMSAVAAYAGVPVDTAVAVTGSVQGDQVVPVAGIEEKWEAMQRKDSGFERLILPVDDIASLPAAARTQIGKTIVPVSTLEDAVVEVLGPALGLAPRRLRAAELSSFVRSESRGEMPDHRRTIDLRTRGDRGTTKPATTIDLRIVPDDVSPDAPTRLKFTLGDRIRFAMRADGDCHVALISFGTSGRATVLLPNASQPEPVLHEGSPLIFPPGSPSPLSLQGPPGIERFIALAGSKPWRLTPADFGQSGTLARPTAQALRAFAESAGNDLLATAEVEVLVVDAHAAERHVPLPKRGAIGPAPRSIEERLQASEEAGFRSLDDL